MKKSIIRFTAMLLIFVVLFSFPVCAFADDEVYNLEHTMNIGDEVEIKSLLPESHKEENFRVCSEVSDVVSVVDGQKIVAVNEGVITFTAESYSCDNYYGNYYNEYYDGTPLYGINEVVTATYNITITVNKAVENDIHESKPDNNKNDDKPLAIKGEVLPYCKEIAKMSLTHSNLKRVVYGKSVMGKPLEAYEIYNKSKNNKYKNTLFIDFAVHGFEDEYYRDGKVLVKEAVRLVKYFTEHSSSLKNYRLIIVVCANPDGTFDGKNNSRANSRAFGRCTAKHVDMNRDFRRLRGKETRALKKYILKSDPDLYINCHGWENQVIGSRKLNRIIRSRLNLRRTQNDVYCYNQGFAIGWVHRKLEIPVALLEYKNTSSVSTKKDIKMIKNIIKKY